MLYLRSTFVAIILFFVGVPYANAFVCSISDFPFCKSDDQVSDDLDSIYTSPYDGRQVSWTSDGYQITVSGPQGKAIDIPSTVDIVSDSGSTALVVDDRGLLSSLTVTDADGNTSSFSFNFQDNFLGVSINVPAFGYRASFSLPPIDPFTGENITNVTNNITEGAGGALEDFDDSAIPPRVPKPVGQWSVEDSPTVAASLGIFTSECFRPINPTRLLVAAIADGENVSVTVEEQVVGYYKAYFSVVGTALSDDILGAICDAVNFVGHGCPAILAMGLGGYVVCAKISDPIKPPRVAAAVFAVCSAAFTSSAAFCTVYEAGSTAPGGPNVIDSICETVANDLAPYVEDLFFPESINVTATAHFLSDTVTKSVTFDPTTTAIGPPIILEGPGKPELINFRAIPEYPVAGQTYTAFAFVLCSSNTTSATISVKGNDDYTGSTTCSGSDMVTRGGCSLQVPGAEDGIVDTISISLTDPLIGERFEVISVFFG